MTKKHKHMTYALLALGMLLFALPRLDAIGEFTAASIFAAVWVGFAVLAIAANLYRVLGVDEVTAAELEQIRKVKRWQTEQLLSGKSGRLNQQVRGSKQRG
jgi:nitric oxide reductase large subunit